MKIATKQPIVRCTDCLHYKGPRHADIQSPCSKLGVRPGAPAPDCYSPNTLALLPNSASLAKVVDLFSKLKEDQARIVAGCFVAASALERTGFSLFQKLYFCVGSKDVLTDWRVGYLMCKERNKLTLVSDLGKTTANTAIVDVRLAQTQEQFVATKAKLLASGKVVPASLANKAMQQDYEPVAIKKSDMPAKPKRKPTKLGFDINQ